MDEIFSKEQILKIKKQIDALKIRKKSNAVEIDNQINKLEAQIINYQKTLNNKVV